MIPHLQQRIHLFWHRHAYRQARRAGLSSLAARERAQLSFPLSDRQSARRPPPSATPEFKVSAIARLSSAGDSSLLH